MGHSLSPSLPSESAPSLHLLSPDDLLTLRPKGQIASPGLVPPTLRYLGVVEEFICHLTTTGMRYDNDSCSESKKFCPCLVSHWYSFMVHACIFNSVTPHEYKNISVWKQLLLPLSFFAALEGWKKHLSSPSG